MASDNARRSKTVLWRLTQDRRQSRRRQKVCMATAMLFSWPAMITRHHSLFVQTLLLAGMVCALLMRWSASCSVRVTTALCSAEDVEAIGPLLEILMLDCGDLQAEAERALLRLLPRLNGSHVRLLTDAEHRCLYNALRSRNSNLVSAALQALTHVGRPSALPSVQRLARRTQGKQENVSLSHAAARCLEALHQRKEAEQARETLLRETQEANSGVCTLLRPLEDMDNDANCTRQETLR